MLRKIQHLNIYSRNVRSELAETNQRGFVSGQRTFWGSNLFVSRSIEIYGAMLFNEYISNVGGAKRNAGWVRYT